MLRLVRAFLRPQYAGWVSAAAAIYGATQSGKSSGSAGKGGSPVYVPSGQQNADTYWQQMMGQQADQTNRNVGMIDPQLLAAYQKMQGIDTSGLPAAGAAAGQQYGQLAQQGQQMSGALTGAGMGILDAAQDPRQQQYDFSKQQTLEGTRGAQSARGIAMGEQGAGLEADALRGFNIDWRKQQFQRQLQGTAAARGAFGEGQAIGAQVPGLTMQGAMAPIQAQQSAYGMPMDWATQFTNAQNANVIGPQQAQQAGYLPYLGYGAGAGASAGYLGLGQAQFQNAMQTQQLQRYAAGAEAGQNAYRNWGGGGGYTGGYQFDPYSGNQAGYAQNFQGGDSNVGFSGDAASFGY